MSEIAYAVHTRTCTYLLDADGVCRWIVSPTGMVPSDVKRCVGAQFVACLDPLLPGGLAGDLRLGAAALFVKHDQEAGRQILLRTSAIASVECRDPAAQEAIEAAAAPPRTSPPPAREERATPFRFDAEQTVTLTLPLYRPRG